MSAWEEIDDQRAAISARRLSSGYWHVCGKGPCNWAQPPCWPCDEPTLREYAFAQAGEPFIKAAFELALDSGVETTEGSLQPRREDEV